jgi:hypothetical protein
LDNEGEAFAAKHGVAQVMSEHKVTLPTGWIIDAYRSQQLSRWCIGQFDEKNALRGMV